MAEVSPAAAGLNMFCQHIHLWMYVVPAADLRRLQAAAR